MTVPAAPATPALSPISATQINLSWSTPGGTVTGYNVYRSTSAGGEGTVAIGSTTLTTYSDSTVSGGITYYYKVAAVNGSGTGTFSGESSALTFPGVPGGVGATSIPATQINLSWATPGGTATSYNVYRSTSAGNEGTVAIGSTTLTTYSDSAVSGGITYYYKIAAVNGTGTGGQSNKFSAVTAPTGLTAGDDATHSSTQIDLTWTAAGGPVTSYYVYRGAGGPGGHRR